MTTDEKLKLKHKVNVRRKNRRRKAELVREQTDVLARTMYRTPVQVARLTKAVNKADIVNARKVYNRNLSLDRRDPKTGRLMTGRRSRQLKKNVQKGKYSMKALRKALSNIENEFDKVPIFEHFIRRAYADDTVLKSLVGKLLPDLKSVDARITQETPFRLIIDLGGRPQVPMLGPSGGTDE